MAEVSPQVLELLERVREVALSYENTEEYFPWGNRVFFRDLKGRNFLFLTEQTDFLDIGVRLPTIQKEEVLKLPFVETHKWLKNWVSAKVSTTEELEVVLPWIKTSYEMNKPFRGKADGLEGENASVLDWLEQVREVALGFGDIEEYFPFGDRAFRRRKGQIFLYASEREDELYVNVRLPMGEREYALSLPFVDVPKYIGHKGWVGAKVSTQEELDTVIPWIHASYEMNQPVKKGKKVSRQGLG